MDRMIRILFVLALAGSLRGVVAFRPPSSSFASKHPGSSCLRITKSTQTGLPFGRTQLLKNSNNNDENDDENGGSGSFSITDSIGLACQPVVWISLYSVATTGGGLPAGPGGSIGALEGISYLVVLVLALLPRGTTAQTVSRMTIGLGLLVLAGLVADQGCVPNAKPILDYSAYLPVCSSE